MGYTEKEIEKRAIRHAQAARHQLTGGNINNLVGPLARFNSTAYP
ncbi:hypothetical protein WG8_4879 [Paenibacillus sp. Aloe-11]|nr:hypothetical protein WG8_4879 [Paenibacillus sp. Aloe-11]